MWPTFIKIDHIKRKFSKYPIIVNTSSHKSDDKIIKFCKKEKINYFRGDLNNVFDRTIKCCKNSNLSLL